MGSDGHTPPEILKNSTKLRGEVLLGKLLFKSTSLLGEKAVRIELSCNSCHPSGHVNTSFYIAGLSEKPGTIDLTNSFWGAGQEDNKFNPIPIPTLRGVSKTAPYGSQLNLTSLAAFTSHVMIDEFGAPPPQKTILKALLSYMNELGTEQSEDTYIQVEPPEYLALLDLLAEPLRAKDISEFDFRASLLREEFGRRVTQKNRAILIQAAQKISEITQKLKTDPIAANRVYLDLKEFLLKED